MAAGMCALYCQNAEETDKIWTRTISRIRYVEMNVLLLFFL